MNKAASKRGDDDAHEDLETAESVLLDPRHAHIAKEVRVGVVPDPSDPPFWTRFERFLRSNEFEYGLVPMQSRAWLEEALRFDAIVWRPRSTPHQLAEARDKIHLLERHHGKAVYPSVDEVSFYENKLMQAERLRALGLPIIDTFVSFDRDEALAFVEKEARYPLVSKIRTGSSSKGVELVRSRGAARRIVKGAFSRRGRKSVWPALRQKGYVLFQEFVPPRGPEVRVIVIDREFVFGYKRTIPEGDFRASGRGRLLKEALPARAVALALEAWEKLGFTSLAIDFLQGPSPEEWLVVEATIFAAVWSDKQLKVEGRPGRYRWPPGAPEPEFVPGRWWPQELVLRRFLQSRFGRE